MQFFMATNRYTLILLGTMRRSLFLYNPVKNILDAIFYKFRIGGKAVSVTEQHLYVDFVYPAISLIIAG